MLLNPAALERGKQIHTEFTKAGLYLDVCLMNAFISMYTRCQGINPDKITYIYLFRACRNGAALTEGKQLHCHALQAGFGADMSVRNSLIDMYGKHGSLGSARQVFEEMAEQDVVSWNVMIAGLAQHGCSKDALELFEQVKRGGFTPNTVTFVGLLSACSHTGLVDEGSWHYGCMVDLLGCAGQLDDTEELINKMSLHADSSVWNSVLGACRIHGNIQLAEFVKPRCSWIEVKSKVHSFVADDVSHPQTEEIYAELDELTRQIKEAGYVPDTYPLMHYFEEQQEEQVISQHSEKLVIAFGLMTTASGSPIHVIKHLGVYMDCHTATKFISKVSG
ncbi:hypothetical protein CY35_04G064300 [Sphagnum magellanicum]|nr:hypothetical protein CY35_04G064300 [Sphagnum magellanicum]